MQPDWTGIRIEEFPVKFGHILKFERDSLKITAIVLDFDEEEDSKWIGVCFFHENRLFGRQIPSGLINTSCLDLLDITYINADLFLNYEIEATHKLDKTKIGIGSQSPVTSFDEIIRDFNWGLERRKIEQTACNRGLFDLNPVRECYFDLQKIKD